MTEEPLVQDPQSEKPPLWADLLLTLWVIVVGLLYCGGYFFPAVGSWTPSGGMFFALMVVVSVLVLALRYLRTSTPQPGHPSSGHPAA
jgi:hypothetical protein